jgi:hypothetical protein
MNLWLRGFFDAANFGVHGNQFKSRRERWVFDLAFGNLADSRLRALAALSHRYLRDSRFRQIGDDFFPVHVPIISEVRYAGQAANRLELSEY